MRQSSPARAAFDADFTATPSVSFFAASGDSAKNVLYPSASPDVVSVGGTTLTVDTGELDTWQGESAWARAGGGCSALRPATRDAAGLPLPTASPG